MTMTRLVRPMDSNATLVGKEQIDFPKHVGSVGLTSSKGFALHKTGHYGRDVARYTSCKILEEPERAITRCGTARGMRTPPFKSEMHCPFYIRNAAFEHPCSKKSYENIEKLKYVS